MGPNPDYLDIKLQNFTSSVNQSTCCDELPLQGFRPVHGLSFLKNKKRGGDTLVVDRYDAKNCDGGIVFGVFSSRTLGKCRNSNNRSYWLDSSWNYSSFVGLMRPGGYIIIALMKTVTKFLSRNANVLAILICSL